MPPLKRFVGLSVLFFFCLLMTSCATNHSPTINADLTKETWRYQLNTNPTTWQRYADRWFLTGKPNATEMTNRHASYRFAMSRMQVRVSNFTKIRFNGNFQLQLFGTDGPNTVYILGPNEAVGSAILRVSNDTLCIDQRPDAPPNADKVIIRIGMRELTQLIQMGCGTIEGIWLRSHSLTLTTTQQAGSRIYLMGNLRVRHIQQAGQTSINIFGANTPDLYIQTSGHGEVNLCGDVGVRSIIHHGSSNINIIGAHSGRLDIIADGDGKIGIKGQVNLRDVSVKDNVRVYVSLSTSDAINVALKNKARVGIAGFTNELNVVARNESRFLGRYLCTHQSYVKAYDSSHVNVNGASTLGMASQDGSIYYFGPARLLTSYTSGNGIVLPLFDDSRSCHIFNRTYVMRLHTPRYERLMGEG